ncbi:MAG: N-6 DNA methylase [Planctomycetota bacterium]|nr:N-6 DNA methylase [Planctomycetota bacterium]
MSISGRTDRVGAPKEILDLVNRFREQYDSYRLPSYGETELRREFIDPFFKALGWDIDNEQGNAEAYKDVVHEDSIKIGVSTKAPDYSFRIGGVRKFFVEAKKPSVNIGQDISPAFQLRRYGWSAKLPLSILTDFEEFAVYDCRVRPEKNDKASTARTMFFTYEQYDERWDEIAAIFSLDAIRKGSFDRYAESTKKKRGTAEVDDAFLKEIEQWRSELARNLAARNAELSQREINFAVQKTIDRIIFLRICEDRGIEIYGGLQSLTSGPKIYPRLCELFRKADDRYNSGLFHFTKEKHRHEDPDEWTLSLQVDDRVLKDIIRNLYYPESPYEFSVLGSEILGQVYEQFLGKVIRLTKGHQAKVEDKPEVKKAGGVYYTPTYIVDYIVEQTVGKLLEGKTPHEVAARTKTTWKPAKGGRPLTVLDPACGSGSFLIGAYQYLLDWYRDWYVEHGPAKHKDRIYQTRKDQWRLTTAERKRILLDHIYGVDIDTQAVEVTKLSLLLKVLEGENQESLQRQLRLFRERALPDLADNIKCGNSLIGPDFYKGKQLDLFDEDERLRINVFDWSGKDGFREIMKSGGFDAVLGNPPYVRVSNVDEHLRPYLYSTYEINHRFDIYVVFVRRALELLSETGRFGFIVPNKFFTSDYGESLRSSLSETRAITNIVDFGDTQVFAGATIYTCLLFLSKQSHTHVNYKEANTTRTSQQFIVRREVNVPAERLSTSAWAFVDAQSGQLLDRFRDFPRLGDLCKIKHGLQTGMDAVFLLTKASHESNDDTIVVTSAAEPEPFSIETAAVRRVVKGAVDLRRYYIEASERYVLFPYNVKDQAALIESSEFAARYPLAWAYLNRHAKELRSKQKPGEWYGFRRRNYDLRDAVPRLLVPSISQRACFVSDLAGEYHFVGSGGGGGGGYGLYARNEAPSLHFLLGLLNSKLLDWLVKLSNSRFGHGYYSYNRQYIEPLPIRVPEEGEPRSESLHDGMVGLVEQMLTLHKRSATAKTTHERTALARQISATDEEIDRLVYELYGLTDEEIRIVEEATAR